MSVIVDLLDLRQSHAFQLAAISGVAGDVYKRQRQYRTILRVESRRPVFWQVKQKAQRILCVFTSIFVTVAGKSADVYKRQAIKYARVKCIRDADGIVVDYEVEGDFPKYGNDDDRVDRCV